MRVMVTGGAGYIGSVVTEELLRAAHQVVVYDDLSKGHRWAVPDEAALVVADLLDGGALRRALRGVEAVVHMAAVSLVGASMTDPAGYYRGNVVAGLELLEAMREGGVGRLVFSSTAAVYGEPAGQPISEDEEVRPQSPYGETKAVMEGALRWYGRAYGLRHVSLRYFNAAGATARCGEAHEPETHLIPLLLEAALEQRGEVVVNGADYPTPDGTCVRDYIHVVDLARAHVRCLEALDRQEVSAVYNLGCGGRGHSVLEVLETARRVTGRRIPARMGPRRAGDPAVLVASPARIERELGFVAEHQDLEAIIGSAWAWTENRKPARTENRAPGRPRCRLK